MSGQSWALANLCPEKELLYLLHRRLGGPLEKVKISGCQRDLNTDCPACGPPLWSSGQSFWLQIQRSRVRSPALPDFLSSSGSGTGSTQPSEPREVN